MDYLGFHGHKLLDVNGTFLNLPYHESIRKEFGVRDMGRGTKKDVPKSMCLLSMLNDPVNYLNRTFAYWSAKGILIGMFIERMIRRALALFDDLVQSYTEIVRPGRSSPRKNSHPGCTT